jgi:hypothetical protein
MIVPVANVAPFLNSNHYLGASKRGFAWSDEFGVVVLASPTSRHLPNDWLELSRWCLVPGNNNGSRQWARIARWLKHNHTVTTVVSYSDPSVGHTGALYAACNWIWAPTWQRLRPPPTGGGNWGGKKQQAPKDRWVYPLRPDLRRIQVLKVNDESLIRKGCPSYKEPQRFMKERT